MLLRYILIAIAAYLLYRWYKGLGPVLKPAPENEQPDRDPHDVLGVEEDADQATIRKAYNEAIKQYHPDKIADMAPELRRLAERRTIEINAAYEKLRSD